MGKRLPIETGLAAATALAVLLDGRAWNGAVRAEHAAIAGFRFQPLAAALAVIEELAGVSRHGFGGPMIAIRALNGRYELHRNGQRQLSRLNVGAGLLSREQP